jgi:DNA-binding CsgD family transcriptional regulator
MLADYQRQCCSGSFAAALLRMCYSLDVRPGLPAIQALTLVLHREEDRAAPAGQSRVLADGIRSSRMVTLPGRSHLPYVGEVAPLIAKIRSFLGLAARSRADHELTPRQWEVAELVSRGMTNREIGRRLGIEERSAEGHVERIRLRLGVRSRAQVAAWWAARSGWEPESPAR